MATTKGGAAGDLILLRYSTLVQCSSRLQQINILISTTYIKSPISQKWGKREKKVLDFWDDINFLLPWSILEGIVTKGASKIMTFLSRAGAGSQTHSIIARCSFSFSPYQAGEQNALATPTIFIIYYFQCLKVGRTVSWLIQFKTHIHYSSWPI